MQEHWQSSAPGPEAALTHVPHQEPQGATVPLLPGAAGAAVCVGRVPSGVCRRDDSKVLVMVSSMRGVSATEQSEECCRHQTPTLGCTLCSFSEFLDRRCLLHSALPSPPNRGGHPGEGITELTNITGLSYSLGRPPTPELRDPGRALPPTPQLQWEGQAGKLRSSKLKDTLLPGSAHQVRGREL